MRFLIPALFFLSSCATAPAGGLERIETIVVIYAENRSFDHLYGLFSGANGIAEATEEQKTQLDLDGSVLPHLPPVFTPQGKPDERFPGQLPDGPFRQVQICHRNHRLQPGQSISWRVGVNRRQRTFVAGVHGLKHVQRLFAAALAHDYPVGPHTQAVHYQVADRYLSSTLYVRWTRFQRDNMHLL